MIHTAYSKVATLSQYLENLLINYGGLSLHHGLLSTNSVKWPIISGNSAFQIKY